MYSTNTFIIINKYISTHKLIIINKLGIFKWVPVCYDDDDQYYYFIIKYMCIYTNFMEELCVKELHTFHLFNKYIHTHN